MFWKLKKKSNCHIWLMPDPQKELDSELQNRFNAIMRRLHIPKNSTDWEFSKKLERISRTLNHNLCYKLSSKKIIPETRITYQTDGRTQSQEEVRRFSVL